MFVKIDRFQFEGPFKSTNELQSKSGVYAILSRSKNGILTVIDIGESMNILQRIVNHDRTDCWRSKNPEGGSIEAAALYCNETERISIERELRNKFSNLCGTR